jgi:protein-disulfide isomerase
VSLQNAAIKGDPRAKVAIIEYSDFQCPYCGRFARDTLPELEARYLRTGRALLAFRHLPIEQKHPHALNAGVSVECAGRRGKFWEMHDRLFQNQALLDPPNLRAHAQAIGLDASEFDKCLETELVDKVRLDGKAAQALSITGTPTFLIGPVEPDGRVKVLHRLSGTRPIAEFAAVLDGLLKIR